MTYTLTLETREELDLAVAALRAEADRRTRVAEKLAGRVKADKARRQDVRPDAVKVTMLLGDSADLRAMADTWAATEQTGLIAEPIVTAATLGLDAPPVVDEPLPGVDGGPMGDDDDGLSEEAQRIAELAGLTADDPDARAYDPTEPEDPETGATSEDDPTDTEIEEVP